MITQPVAKIAHYGYLDAVRGWAILGVFLIHAEANIVDLNKTLYRIAERGGAGVQLFFVASALTLFISYESRKTRDRRPLLAFFARRFFRIAPYFWAAIGFYLWWYGMTPRFSAPGGIDQHTILATFFFLHGWRPDQINAVVPGGWSIAVEMSFYIIAPFFFIIGRTVRGAIILFVCTFILSGIISSLRLSTVLFPDAHPSLRGVWETFWLPAQLPVFALGVLAFHLVRRPQIPPAVILVLAPLVALAATPLSPQPVYCGIAFVLLIWALSINPTFFLVNKFTRHMGRISFSSYLTHFAVIDILRGAIGITLNTKTHWNGPSIAASWFDHPVLSISGLPATGQFIVLFILTTIFTLTISTITYYLIEIKIIKIGQLVINKLGWGEC